jgi:amino acid permease
MVTYLPIASPFVRLAGFWVDDALSFAMGWNYFFLMGMTIIKVSNFVTNNSSLQHPLRNHGNPRSPHLLDG